MKKIIFLLSLLIITSGCSSWSEPGQTQLNTKEQNINVNNTVKEIHPLPAFEKALSLGDKEQVSQYLDYKLDFIIEATEAYGCLGNQKATENIFIRFDTVNFDQNQDLVKKIRKYYTNTENLGVGINNEGNIVMYKVNNKNKVDYIYVTFESYLNLNNQNSEELILRSTCDKNMNDHFGEYIIDRAILNPVNDYQGEGFATREWDSTGKTFDHFVDAELNDPAKGKFYEGWLVNADGQFFSTGKMIKSNNYYQLKYSDNQFPNDYTKIVITEETSSLGLDNNPETHVLEGEF